MQNGQKASTPIRKDSKDSKNALKFVFLFFDSSLFFIFLNRAFEVGAQRPTPGSIGKLRISSEMRYKLEMVTSTHSVRSTNKPEKPALPNMNPPPKKIEDNRRLLLEQQLGSLIVF